MKDGTSRCPTAKQLRRYAATPVSLTSRDAVAVTVPKHGPQRSPQEECPVITTLEEYAPREAFQFGVFPREAHASRTCDTYETVLGGVTLRDYLDVVCLRCSLEAVYMSLLRRTASLNRLGQRWISQQSRGYQLSCR